MYYYLIIALQVYCVYHLYKNKNDYYWIFLIIFLPLIGCIIYLITQVYNKQDADKLTSEIETLINPSKKVNDLEKRLQFSETFQNRIDLADAYFENLDYDNAIKHYEIALKDSSQSDFYVVSKLASSYYKKEDFKKVIFYSEKVNTHFEFKKSHIQFLYGLALEKIGKIEEAEIELRQIDSRYSNYEERLVLAKFLISINKNEDAKDVLNEIYLESQHMTKLNKRKYRITITEVEKLLNSL